MGKKRKSSKRQSSNALRRNGFRAFENKDYESAIEAWERVERQTPDMLPKAALAEAYFRRGLHRFYKTGELQQGLEDLRRASERQPESACYKYHIGLAHHHRGDLDGAIRAYRCVREMEDEFSARAAYPLALALLQQGGDPTASDVWSALSDQERAMLEDVGAFRRRPYTLSDDAPPLWRALAALDAGREAEAQRLLEDALEKAANPVEQQIAHYYEGVLAAQQEDWETALRAWNAARAAGLRTERLEQNVQEVAHRLAEELLEAEEVRDALMVGEDASRHGSSSPSLEALLSQAHQRLAHQAANAGHWAEAQEHWEAAETAEDGSFRLAYNLALAHERAEEFLLAGERWREALRRRPRSDDHVDAITDDQVARLWQRAAQAYTRAGEYDEAVQVYKNAVKWNPERLEARLALSEALLLNGQLQAAENELERILERDPDNIPALLRLGEVAQAQGNWWRADPTRYWERVLELEPDHVTARQLLVDYCLEQADRALSFFNYDWAIELYNQVLTYWPDNPQALSLLGGVYLALDERTEAEAYFEKAMNSAPPDLSVYDYIIHTWLIRKEPDTAWRVLERLEKNVTDLHYEFYIMQASYCVDAGEEVWRPWLERALEKAPPGEPALVTIGEMAMDRQAVDLGREYLERALEADQYPGQVHLLLGILAMQDDDAAEAEVRWSEAWRIARQTDDEALMERIEQARVYFSTPRGFWDMIEPLGLEGFEGLEDLFDDDLDEVW